MQYRFFLQNRKFYQMIKWFNYEILLLQKSTHFCSLPFFIFLIFLILLRTITKRRKWHITGLCYRCPCNFSFFPFLIHGIEIFRQRCRRSAETHSLCPGGGNALGLSLSDVTAVDQSLFPTVYPEKCSFDQYRLHPWQSSVCPHFALDCSHGYNRIHFPCHFPSAAISP